MQLIDSHAHLTCEPLKDEAKQLALSAQECGITNIVNICTDSASLEAGIELHNELSFVVNAASTTPHDVEKEGKVFFPLVEQACQENRLVAVGETGLDYFYLHSPKQTQQYYFRRYIALAAEYSLPLIIHCRDAFEDFFSIVDAEYRNGQSWGPLVLHCFTGTIHEAQEVLRRGFYLSLSGIVTFNRSEELREVAKITPLDRLLIETDSPYLAPVPKRGKRNEPSFLPYTCELIGKTKDIETAAVAKATYENAKLLFKL